MFRINYYSTLLFVLINLSHHKIISAQENNSSPFIEILGTLQDGGAPHLGCVKSCCLALTQKEKNERSITSLALHHPSDQTVFLFEATPDIQSQWEQLGKIPEGIFITHAHIGHYSGLLQLGREVLGAKNIPVYVMPKLQSFLEKNGPWSQLVELKNISIRPIKENLSILIAENLSITPFTVPHRDEFSETVGYHIQGPKKAALFIPDIDKWVLWDNDLLNVLQSVDFAFIDGTFFDSEEISNRSLKEIPHPFVVETMSLLKDATPQIKNKIYFIHMNHSNPLLNPESIATKQVLEAGFQISRKGQKFSL